MLRSGNVVARNKHPEETVNRILTTAFRLFMEKGYEHTSVQEIDRKSTRLNSSH